MQKLEGLWLYAHISEFIPATSMCKMVEKKMVTKKQKINAVYVVSYTSLLSGNKHPLKLNIYFSAT
jgi:hypothetical protein